MRTYHTEVIGCKVNQCETQQISEFFDLCVLSPAKQSEASDLAIVHSFAVTSRAVAKTRQAVARADAAEFAKFGAKVKLVPEAQDIAGVLYSISSKQGGPNTFSISIKQGSKAIGRDKQCMMATKAKAAAAVGNPVSRIKPLFNHIQAGTLNQVKGEFIHSEPGAKPALGPISRFSGHQRGFVKVRDGCDAFFSYCIVPYLRPRLASHLGVNFVSQR